MKVTILGSAGQLGTDLRKAFAEEGRHQVTALTHEQMDVTRPSGLVDALGQAEPDAVINCAAYHKVDECEDQTEKAFGVNAIGALNIARACAELEAKCVYISSDYVFDGAKGTAYLEGDLPNPLNVYGASKVAGEHLVAQACPGSVVARTASLFGAAGASGKGGNFVEAIITKARAGGPLKVVNDIRMSPTYTLDAARAIAELLNAGSEGTFHVTNAGSATWYEFAGAILNLTGHDVPLEPTGSDEWPATARRPAYSSLSSDRIDGPAEAVLRDWDGALKGYLAEKGHI